MRKLTALLGSALASSFAIGSAIAAEPASLGHAYLTGIEANRVFTALAEYQLPPAPRQADGFQPLDKIRQIGSIAHGLRFGCRSQGCTIALYPYDRRAQLKGAVAAGQKVGSRVTARTIKLGAVLSRQIVRALRGYPYETSESGVVFTTGHFASGGGLTCIADEVNPTKARKARCSLWIQKPAAARVQSAR